MDLSNPALVLIPILWVIGALATAWSITWADIGGLRRGDIVWLSVWPAFWIGVLLMALVEFFQYVRRRRRRSNRNVNEEEYYNGE